MRCFYYRCSPAMPGRLQTKPYVLVWPSESGRMESLQVRAANEVGRKSPCNSRDRNLLEWIQTDSSCGRLCLNQLLYILSAISACLGASLKDTWTTALQMQQYADLLFCRDCLSPFQRCLNNQAYQRGQCLAASQHRHLWTYPFFFQQNHQNRRRHCSLHNDRCSAQSCHLIFASQICVLILQDLQQCEHVPAARFSVQGHFF